MASENVEGSIAGHLRSAANSLPRLLSCVRLRVVQTDEPALIQALIAEPPIEALGERVLGGHSRSPRRVERFSPADGLPILLHVNDCSARRRLSV